MNYAKLRDYRPGIRPVAPESLPAHVDRELAALRAIISEQKTALQDLNARLVAGSL